MKPPRFEYHRPAALGELLELKARWGGEAAVLVGGQSLVPMLNFRLARPAAIVDIGGIESLAHVEFDRRALRVGAMARQRTVERALDGRGDYLLLLEAIRHVAHPIIRNRGTIGGSLAHADPAAELPAALLALDGRVRVASLAGERWIAAADLFVFHLTTSLYEDEVLIEAEFPALDERTEAAVVEVSRRHGDFALAGVCATVTAAADGRTVAGTRLAYLGIAPTPVRGVAAEQLLAGEEPSGALFRAAGRLAAAEVRATDADQASTAYRRELVAVVTERALAAASGRLRAAGHLQ